MGLPQQTLIHSNDGIMNDRGKYMSSKISLLQCQPFCPEKIPCVPTRTEFQPPE